MKKQRTMTVNATAIWNEEKGTWECCVKTLDHYQNLQGQWRTQKRIYHNKISACDEFVLPYAILDSNGIDLSVIEEKVKSAE